MRVIEVNKRLVAQAIVEWRRLSKGQKKYILAVSLPGSVVILLVLTLGFIVGWSCGSMTFDHIVGNQSDGFLMLVYWGIRNALDYWWVALTPLITTPLALGYIEYKSRFQAQ